MTYPYTYLIQHLPTKQYYCGVRTANKIPAADDFWVKYFTSSKVVKSLIKERGTDSFKIISIIEHESNELAMEFEELTLLDNNASKNPNWLNKHIHGTNFTTTGIPKITKDITRVRMSTSGKGKPKTEEHKAKIRASSIGKHNHRKGIPLTEEHKANIRISAVGRAIPKTLCVSCNTLISNNNMQRHLKKCYSIV